MRFLQTASWTGCFMGMFFIMASREHYSIDVFLAFFVTSVLFLYYHSMADSGAATGRGGCELPVPCLWIPLLGYFESSIDGFVPNEYEWPLHGIAASVRRAFSSIYSSVGKRSNSPFLNV
jgi:hypothetical protein